MPLLAEDTIQAINSITEIHLEETIKQLEKLFYEYYINSSHQEFLEELKQISDLKNKDFNKVLETIQLSRTLQTKIQDIKLIIEDNTENSKITITDTRTIAEINKLLESVKQTLRTIEAGAVVILLIVALKSEVKDEAEWLKNLNTSLLELFYGLEKNHEMSYFSDFLKVDFQEIFSFLVSSEMKKWKSKDKSQEEVTQNYANSIRTTTKAILWEINQNYNDDLLQKFAQITSKKDNNLRLVIGKKSYKELLQESQKRIHLLDTLDPETDEELRIQLEALDVVEREFGEKGNN